MLIFGKEINLQIIRNNVLIPCDGILGAEYLEKFEVIIDFSLKMLRNDDGFQLFSNLIDQISITNNYTSHIPNIDKVDFEGDDYFLDEYDLESFFIEETPNFSQTHSLFLEKEQTFKDLNIESYNKNTHFLQTYSIQLADNLFKTQVKNIDSFNKNSRVDLVKEKIRVSHLDKVELEQAYALIENNADRFYLEGVELPCTNVVTHRIPTTDTMPVNTRQYI